MEGRTGKASRPKKEGGQEGGWEKLKEGEQEKTNNSIAEVQTQKYEVYVSDTAYRPMLAPSQLGWGHPTRPSVLSSAPPSPPHLLRE